MNDIIFKMVFGQQENESLLRALLNSLLGRKGGERIVNLELRNPQLDKSYVQDRGVILDIKARDELRRWYNIEVQVADEPAFIQRSLYYLARLFAEQLSKGDPFEQITQTIGISLVDYSLFPELADFHSTYRFYDARHERELTNLLEIHYLELVKFEKDKPRDLRTPFEKWLHVLKFGELYERELEPLPKVLKSEEGIEMAIKKMRQVRASDQVREMIEVREKALHVEASRLFQARQKGIDEGRQQGIDEGRQQGIDEGRQQGRQEGARQEQLKMGRKLLASGMDLAKVAEITGLRAEELH